MMIDFLVVDDATSTVVNVIVWDGEEKYNPAPGTSLVEQPGEVGIGWTKVGDTWTPPPPPAPPEDDGT